MNVVIHEDRGPGQLSWTAARYARILERNGIACRRTHLVRDDFWTTARAADIFIFRIGLSDYDRQIADTVLPVLDRFAGITCFPATSARLLYEDKIRQSLVFDALGIGVPQSWAFFDYESALGFVHRADYPLVLKLRKGAGSNGVVLLRNEREAAHHVALMFRKGLTPDSMPGAFRRQVSEKGIARALRKSIGAMRRARSREECRAQWQRERNYVYFQEYLPGNEHDTRVVVVGERAVAFRRLNRPGDFRASGSGIDNFDPAQIDRRAVRIAFEACEKLGTPIMAFDFLTGTDGAPKLVEASFAYGSPATGPRADSCPGYFTPDAEWIDDDVDTAHYEISELLGRDDLERVPREIRT